jgi:nitric oxide reductase NorD protein
LPPVACFRNRAAFGLDAGGDNHLTRIFGRHNVLQVDRIVRLPEKLPLLYFRLTS